MNIIYVHESETELILYTVNTIFTEDLVIISYLQTFHDIIALRRYVAEIVYSTESIDVDAVKKRVERNELFKHFHYV